ncbi:MAG: hypothetical protein P8L77_01480 [Gammaproteobacteria bacterium]|nr:hypothetical protein [Gammaproteobacteria bacterium]
MFEKLKNLITFLFYFSISIPFIAYAFTRILISLIFQSINVLLLGINYGTYSLESYLAKQLKNNTRTAYQALGENSSAYGFIFIKNIPFYALKALHATLIIAFLLPLHIMVQSFAFLTRKINLPTAKFLKAFIIQQTKDNTKAISFFSGKDANNGFWIFDQLANFDFWATQNFYLTKKKFVRPSLKELNIVNTSTDWIRKSLYKLNYITSFVKEIVSFIASIMGVIVGIIVVSVKVVQEILIKGIFRMDRIQSLYMNFIETLFYSFTLLFGPEIPIDNTYNHSTSLLYASFIALEYFVIRAIDTITEIVSVPFRFLSQALYTLYELFTDQDFDYRKFEDSLYSYQLDQKDVATPDVLNNSDTNDEINLAQACKTLS